MKMVNKDVIIRGAKIELAKRKFFYYCNLKAPDFYKNDRKFLIDLCTQLQDFYESDEEVLIVNIPQDMGSQERLDALLNGFLV